MASNVVITVGDSLGQNLYMKMLKNTLIYSYKWWNNNGNKWHDLKKLNLSTLAINPCSKADTCTAPVLRMHPPFENL
jgi:hypothetical protein